MSPPGYREAAGGGTHLVALDAEFDALRNIVAAGTIHEWASRQPGARALQGRGVAWATTLASGANVVVRHSRHGGALALLTGDLFLSPTRAPRELELSLRLCDSGVPTPAVVGYAVYQAIGRFCRADVVSAFVDGVDFPEAWSAAHSPAARDGIIDAVAALLRTMRAAGARHPDLNVKNILVAEAEGAPLAWLLDVDRVEFGNAGHAALGALNARRLRRSLAKWRLRHGLDVSDAHWARLAEGAGVRSDGTPRL